MEGCPDVLYYAAEGGMFWAVCLGEGGRRGGLEVSSYQGDGLRVFVG